MKHIFFSLGMLVTVGALANERPACPDLHGRFRCEGDVKEFSGGGDVTVRMDRKDGRLVYWLPYVSATPSPVYVKIADGVARSRRENAGHVGPGVVTDVTRCVRGALVDVSVIELVNPDTGERDEFLRSETRYRASAKGFTVVTKLKQQLPESEPREVVQRSACERSGR